MFIKGNVKELFSKVNDYWSPKIIGEVNSQYIKIAKLKGQFVWHAHELDVKSDRTKSIESQLI